MNGLKIHENWCEDPPRVKEEIKNHFMLKFSSLQQTTVRLDNIPYHRMDEDDNRAITRNFTKDEIKETV